MTSYTREQIRGAILRAADVHESFPYTSVGKLYVRPIGEHGCPLSIVARELGADVGANCDVFLHKHAGFAFTDLQKFAEKIYHGPIPVQKASAGSTLLRKFADAYFPAATTALVPFSQCSWRSAAIARLKALPAYSPTLKDVDEARVGV